jgi:hypothetical protein
MSEDIHLFSSTSGEQPSFFMLHGRSNRAQNGRNVLDECQPRLAKKSLVEGREKACRAAWLERTTLMPLF